MLTDFFIMHWLSSFFCSIQENAKIKSLVGGDYDLKESKMKKPIYLSLLAIGLAGCATQISPGNIPVPEHLSDTEKQLVESGKEVRITGYQFGHNFSSYVPGVNTPRIKQGIYVCATPISNPTEDTPCYPRLSQFFGNQFEKRGVKIAAAKSGADAIVFAIVKYNYRNVFVRSGDDYQKKIMDDMEQSLESGNEPALTMKQLPGEELYKSDQASIDQENAKNRVEGSIKVAAYAALSIASAILGQPGAGAQASEAMRGATDTSVAGSGMVVDKSEKVLTISLHGLNLTKVRQDKVISGHLVAPIAYIYKGPVSATNAFPSAFNEALNVSLERFIMP